MKNKNKNNERPRSSVKSGADKKYVKLGKVLAEFVSSEKSYAKRLHLINKVVRAKLYRAGFTYIPTELFFTDINLLHDFHATKLEPEFQSCLNYYKEPKNFSKKLVGQTFVSLAKGFQLYPVYAVNYQRIINSFDDLMKKDAKFRKFIEAFQETEESLGLKVKHLFIEPIQRLPRYELLLKEYISCLDELNEDFASAKKALEDIKEINRLSNEKIRNEENLLKVKEIQLNVLGSENIVAPGRSYIMEADANTVQPITGKVEKNKLYLFNDILMVCKCKVSKTKKTTYRATHKLPLTTLRYRVVQGRLYLISPMALVEFLPKSKEELQSWVKELSALVKNNKTLPFLPIL